MKNPFESKGRKNQTETQSSTEWDNLNATKFAGDTEIIDRQKENAERQQRKITAYFLYGKKIAYLNIPDIELNAGDEDQLSAQLSDGTITQRDEIDLLATIKKGPIDKFNSEKIYTDITRNKHFSRIIGYLQNGKNGFDGFQHNLAGFEQLAIENPTPIEFEGRITNLLEDLKSTQSPEKYAEYVRDIESLERTMYGKRYEYWQQIKALEQKAKEWNAHQEAEKTHETGESLVKDFGWYEMSRAQAKAGIIANNPGERLPETYIEDAHLCMPEQGLFAVFDGAGGTNYVNGAASRASRLAAAKVKELSLGYNLANEGYLAWALNEASKAIEADPATGLTTGTVAKVIEQNGVKKLAYASVGDSRIYIVHQNASVEQITSDEGEGRYITNALGKIDSYGSSENRTKQFGIVNLWEGDRVLLCSDGVTGDYGDDLISNDEISNIVRLAWNPHQAATELVEHARKIDDRTAIVFEV